MRMTFCTLAMYICNDNGLEYWKTQWKKAQDLIRRTPSGIFLEIGVIALQKREVVGPGCSISLSYSTFYFHAPLNSFPELEVLLHVSSATYTDYTSHSLRGPCSSNSARMKEPKSQGTQFPSALCLFVRNPRTLYPHHAY
jgi:hypothetical protein